VASLTIRNIPEDAKLRFRQVAAAHGRSMEEHLRQMVLNAGVADGAAESKGVSDMTQSFRHFEPDPKAKSRARIEHLIALGRGVDWQPPKRDVGTIKEPDFS
jgi:plasmid stability protein